MPRKMIRTLLFCITVMGLLCFSSIFGSRIARAEIGYEYNAQTKTLVITGSGGMADYYGDSKPWKNYIKDVEHLVISEGITRIGACAFYGCSVVDVDLPDTLRSIGSGAFEYCSELLTVHFPTSLPLTLEGQTFYGCKKLNNIYLPENIHLSYNEFQFCSSLTEIELPSNMTELPKYLFTGCSSLQYVELPRGITVLNTAINNCTGMTEFVIPNHISRIENGAFTGCYALEKVVIPPSVTFIQGRETVGNVTYHGAFFGCDFDKLVFYVVENSYAHRWAVSNGYRFTFISPSLDDINVPRENACFIITNEAGNPVQNAKVNYGGVEGVTDGSGVVYFLENTATGMPLVTVEKDGYLTWSSQGRLLWKKKEPAIYQIKMFWEGTNELKLASALCEPLIEPLHVDNIDLVTETKKITLTSIENLIYKPGSGHFRISCSAVNPSAAYQYELIQGTNTIAVSGDGNFTLHDNQFVKDEKCKVRIYNQSGAYFDSPINLLVEEAKINKETSLSFKKSKMSIKIADDIPLIGGSTFDFDLSVIESKFYLVESVSGIEVGVNIKKTLSDEKDPLKEPRDFVNAVKKAIGQKTGTLTKSQKKTFDKLCDQTFKAGFFNKADVKFLGYGKYDIENNKLSADIVIVFNSTEEYSKTFWVVVVPVVVSGKLEFSTTANFEAGYDFNQDEFFGNFSITPALKFSGFGGVGVGHLVGAGAYGSLCVSGKADIIPADGIETIDLEGELGIKAYVGWLEYEKAIAYRKWNIYTRSEVEAQSLAEQAGNGQFDSTQYKKAKLDYLSSESEWLGGSDSDTVNAMSDSGSTIFQSLLNGTYRNAQPRMISCGDVIYAAFLKMNDTGTGIQTMVTSFDGISWKQPVVVDENAYADDAPQLCADQNGTIWLTYAKTNSTEINSLRDYAESQSIVVGWIDPETLVFNKTHEYPSLGYAHGQQLALVNGQATLAWLDSSVDNDNDVLWSHRNTIYAVVCEGREWAEIPIAVTSVDSMITDLTIREADQTMRIGYFTDIDGDPFTKDDISLFETTETGDVLQAEHCGGTLKTARIRGEESAQYTWNETNALCFSDGTRIEAEGISKEYSVLDDRIYYSADTNGKADLFVMYYNNENGTWSNPVRLTDGGRYFENISIVQMNGQYYALGMHTEVVIEDETVTDDKNLVWAQIRAMNNLCLDDAAYDPYNLVPGEEMTVTLFIENHGDHDVHEIRIEELDQTYACEIPQGTVGELEVSILCPTRLTDYTFTVTEPGESDDVPEDNCYTLAIGYSDLSLSARLQNNNGSYSVLAVVRNEGIQQTQGTVVFSGADGTELAHTDLYTLKAGESSFVTLKLNGNMMPGFDLHIHVNVVSKAQDRTDANNAVDIIESIKMIEGSCGSAASWKLTRDGCLTIIGVGDIKPVDDVWPWKNYKEFITSIVIEEGITGIQGESAFSEYAITEATFPDTMTNCGSFTFSHCNGLTSFTMPISAENVGDGMFNQCKNLERVHLSENTTNIGNMAFSECTKLTEITGTEKVTSIGYSAFRRTGISSFTMPEQMKCVPENMFSECKNLKQVILSANTTSIEGMAFAGCENLEEIIGAEYVTSIGYSAFERCYHLDHFDFSKESVTIMDMAFIESGLTSVELNSGSVSFYVFGYCDALTEATLGSGVTQIGHGSFSDCVNLCKVTFDGDETSLLDTVFQGSENVVIHCRNTSTAYTYAKESIIPYVLTNEKIEASFITPSQTKILEEETFASGGFITVKLNEGLESIQGRAFAECRNMIQIEIPSSVTLIADDAFDLHNPLLIIFCEEDSIAHQYAIYQGIDYIVITD